MKYLSTFVVILVLSTQGFGQFSYYKFSGQGDSLYRAGEWRASAEAYSRAFGANNNGNGAMTFRYNAACSWALAGEMDSAFHHLERAVNDHNYSAYDHIVKDKDLVTLHQDVRWVPLMGKVKSNKDKTEAKFNKPFAARLDSIYQEDQKFRRIVSDVEKEHGVNSKEMYELWKTINRVDSLNVIEVSAILETHGWLGQEVVGREGNMALFLVIQHANLETQEKYLPMMREAVKEGKAQGSSLALLEDRVALRQGRKQIYGSQIVRDENGVYQIAPIEDEGNVNKRRAEVGLEPLEDYVKPLGMTYIPASDR